MASMKAGRAKEMTPRVSSGDRGAPISDLFAQAEKEYPGIEEKIGLSSAALRAGELVRGMRKANGWTQTILAEALGWDQERISNIERGEGTRGPTFDVLTKIADACGYDFSFTPRGLTKTAIQNPEIAEVAETRSLRSHRRRWLKDRSPLRRSPDSAKSES